MRSLLAAKYEQKIYISYRSELSCIDLIEFPFWGEIPWNHLCIHPFQGLIPRARLLLTIGGTFFLGFGPLILIIIATFSALYFVSSWPDNCYDECIFFISHHYIDVC